MSASRNLSTLCFLLMLCLASASAHAANLGELSGKILVEESGDVRLDGKKIEFWGIDTLAGDQQCWKDKRAWNCGEQAVLNLTHHLEDQTVQCHVKAMRDDQSLVVQCYTEKEGKKHDIGGYLVNQGWAMDKAAESQDFYEEDENLARENRRGVWTSRFQTKADWKAGVDHYVDYDKASSPEIKPSNTSQMIVGPAEYVIEPSGGEEAKEKE